MKKVSIARLFTAPLVLPALLTACGGREGTATAASAAAITASPPAEPEKVSLKGKTILWLGSSVTYGSAAHGKSMAEYLTENTGCKSVKWAVPGTTLVDTDSSSYVSRLKTYGSQQSKCDYFFCQLSTNDASQNKKLGSVSDSFEREDFDTRTVCGAIEYIIAYGKEKWGCPVAFYTGPRYASENYQAMVDALLQIQEKWGIYILDFWNDPDFLAKRASEQQAWLRKYMADDIHPNATGYAEWWAPVFEAFISTTIEK